MVERHSQPEPGYRCHPTVCASCEEKTVTAADQAERDRTDRTLGPATAPAASMDDPEIFGPTVYRLDVATAISRGILADYQVIVPQIHDHELHEILAALPGQSPDFDRLRLGAQQAMTLRAITEHDLNRVLVFHSRVRHAEVFARTFATTAGAAPPHLRITDLWTAHVSGRQSPYTRNRLITEFAAHPAAPTRRGRQRPRRALLSNVSVFGEGVDVPAIDAVVFLAPKRSAVAAIQAVGRALRQAPGEGKKATIVIPVYIARGQDTETVLNSSGYRTLWQILQGLRAHDEHFRERLDPALRALLYAAQQGGPEAPERVNEIALVMGLRLLHPDNGSWGMGLDAAVRYLRTFGHLDIPARYTDDRHLPVGLWIDHQRKLHTAGNLPPERITALDAIGMLWKRLANGFARRLPIAASYARAHGHLAVPANYQAGGHHLGRWLSTQRGRRLPAAREGPRRPGPALEPVMVPGLAAHLPPRPHPRRTQPGPARRSPYPRPGRPRALAGAPARQVAAAPPHPAPSVDSHRSRPHRPPLPAPPPHRAPRHRLPHRPARRGRPPHPRRTSQRPLPVCGDQPWPALQPGPLAVR
ncbi:helicase associated domain-containing protein [Streptomyces sp. ISL-94]|uniref:helicase associated domain-containing protein n=1 Tax=Streptomyces sp. ISL-94 TaxID=2819190 RepID=UPI001BECA736|nr:helicase associated domain-containing protein [Streptomyces sp. ISL-94]MBT2479575.1 Helicase associated domain protein [Streptomyces sp. ISL-94]